MSGLFARPRVGRSVQIAIGLVMLLASLCAPQGSESADLSSRFAETSVRMEGAFSADIAAFYRLRNDRPVWLDNGALNADGHYFLDVLNKARDRGIDVVPNSAISGRLSNSLTIAHDRELTELFLLYCYAMRTGGMTPRDVGIIWAMQRPSFSAAQLLDELGRVPLAILVDEQAPPQAAYRRLTTALDLYRAIALRGGWPIVADGPVLDSGQRSERVFVLRRRLELEGYGPFSADESTIFDKVLEQAIETFQQRHGLAPDGRVGRETLAALNISAEERAEQIQLNMERWRWMPRELPARRIEVNIAAAELTLYEEDRPLLAMRTIVGSLKHPTPILQSEVQGVIVNPVWNVPPSIVRNEILPRLRRDPGYLRAQDMRILDRPDDPYGSREDWKGVSGMSWLRLQQQPGPLNALGRIKFDMPNPFDVYLHDTPARTLFAGTARALSHGCIRLQFPERLAAILLHDPEKTFSKKIGEDRPTRLALAAGMPVYLLYWTAFVTDDNQVHFRKDIYGHDAEMRIWPRRLGQANVTSAPPGGCASS